MNIDPTITDSPELDKLLAELRGRERNTYNAERMAFLEFSAAVDARVRAEFADLCRALHTATHQQPWIYPHVERASDVATGDPPLTIIAIVRDLKKRAYSANVSVTLIGDVRESLFRWARAEREHDEVVAVRQRIESQGFENRAKLVQELNRGERPAWTFPAVRQGKIVGQTPEE